MLAKQASTGRTETMTEELGTTAEESQAAPAAECLRRAVTSGGEGSVVFYGVRGRATTAQWHERQESALEWRIHRANLPERWSLETFPWSRPAGREPQADAHVCRTRLRGQTPKTWCWSVRPAWAKRDLPAAFC